MYAKLKQDMRNAGVAVSEGPELAGTDLQKVRDFLFFQGINIGEDFHRYEEVTGGAPELTEEQIAAQEAARLAAEQAAQEEAARQAAEAERVATEEAARQAAEAEAEEQVADEAEEGGE